MRNLVTGARGFVGTHLCKKLRSLGQEVREIRSNEFDLTQMQSLLPLKDEKFDRIFHLAAWTQAGDFCLRHPGEQWIINQKINTHVLDFWARFQPQAKLIALGTSCVYDPARPLSEEYYLQGQPIESLFSYGMTKKMLLVGLMSLQKQYGLSYGYFIPSTLYGPGYHTDQRQLHFIFDLIRKIYLGKYENLPVVLWGDGHQKRELVYIDDFIQQMLQLSVSTENEWINLGAGEEYSIREFAQMICREMGYDFEKIQFDVSRYVGARSKVLDVRKREQKLPEYRMTSLKEGLSRTIEWFHENAKHFTSIPLSV